MEHRADHVQKSSKGEGVYFQETIRTYGPKLFTRELIDNVNDMDELALKKILKYRGQDTGYNN